MQNRLIFLASLLNVCVGAYFHNLHGVTGWAGCLLLTVMIMQKENNNNKNESECN